MYNWKPSPSTKASGWGTAPSGSWRKPDIPKSPGCKPIITEHTTATLLEDDGPEKRPKLKNGALFDLIPMDIVNVMDDQLTGLEHKETSNTIVECIK